ncbi:putative quinol monooxygenase [Streptomyces sp. NPDC051677]|uniref:putative quinol monooxygenase n=1 Tax=Streptomyces sp. NPDC051677 TaxID=3365669 RepID=UPI0037D133BC
MPVVIVRLHPAAGQLEKVLDIYRQEVPLIHAEPGCELFAVHTDGTDVFLVESWATPEDLKAHTDGEGFTRTREHLGPVLDGPGDIRVVDPIPLGVEAKGTLR